MRLRGSRRWRMKQLLLIWACADTGTEVSGGGGDTDRELWSESDDPPTRVPKATKERGDTDVPWMSWNWAGLEDVLCRRASGKIGRHEEIPSLLDGGGVQNPGPVYCGQRVGGVFRVPARPVNAGRKNAMGAVLYLVPAQHRKECWPVGWGDPVEVRVNALEINIFAFFSHVH